MVRLSAKPSPARDLTLFSEVKEPALNSTRFWVQVLAYRPLFLLGSLWLALVCASAIAYHRLMFTEPPLATPSTLARAEVVPTRPATQVDALDNSRLGLKQESNAEAKAVPQLGTKVAVWGLLSLVGLCSLGCFVISQQAKAVPRRSPRPQPTRQNVSKSKRPPMPKPSGPKRLPPYSPERDGVMVQGIAVREVEPLVKETSAFPAVATQPEHPVSQVQPLPSWLTRPSWQADSTRVSAKAGELKMPLSSGRRDRTSVPLATPAPASAHQPTVVPAGEVHPLDWPEASIAHTLDLRQRRSLSSFM